MGLDRSRKNENGFSLLELLLVVVIVATLAALLFPALASAKRRAYIAQCSHNLKQLHQAAVMYAGDHNGFVHRICDVTYTGACDWSGNTNTYRTRNASYYDLKRYIKNTKVWQCPAINPGNPENYTDLLTRRRNDIDYRFNLDMNNTPLNNVHPNKQQYYSKRLDACTLPRKFYLVSDRHCDRHFDYNPNSRTNWIMLMIMVDGHIKTNVMPYNPIWIDRFGHRKYAHWDFPNCHPGQDQQAASDIYRNDL